MITNNNNLEPIFNIIQNAMENASKINLEYHTNSESDEKEQKVSKISNQIILRCDVNSSGQNIGNYQIVVRDTNSKDIKAITLNKIIKVEISQENQSPIAKPRVEKMSEKGKKEYRKYHEQRKEEYRKYHEQLDEELVRFNAETEEIKADTARKIEKIEKLKAKEEKLNASIAKKDQQLKELRIKYKKLLTSSFVESDALHQLIKDLEGNSSYIYTKEFNERMEKLERK